MQTETDVSLVLPGLTLPPSCRESSRATAFPVRPGRTASPCLSVWGFMVSVFLQSLPWQILNASWPTKKGWGRVCWEIIQGYPRSVLRIHVLVWVLKRSVNGWRNGWEIKHTWCSYRGQEPGSRHPCDGFQLSVTLVPEWCSALFWILGYQACKWYAHAYIQKSTHTHKITDN